MRKIFLVLLACLSVTALAEDNQRYISVTGTADITIPADQIEFYLQIEVIDKSIAESKAKNDTYLGELLSILSEMKIDTNDISVSPLEVGKNYERRDGDRVHEGFFATVNIYFLLKDLTKYYELTNKLSTNDHFEIARSDYAVADYEEQNKLAYIDALKAAKAKAQYMAEALGTKITDVLEITDNNITRNYYAANTVAVRGISAGAGSDISGKVKIQRSVDVKFAIE